MTVPFSSRTRVVGLLIVGSLALALFVYASSAFLTLNQQFILSWGLIGLILLIKKVSWLRPEPQRIALICLCLFISVRYMTFRAVDTIVYIDPITLAAMLGLFGAEAYGLLTYALGMFVNAYPLKRKPVVVGPDDESLPSVDVFIPTYNEPNEMVSITAAAAAQMYYPKDKLKVYILDDGGTDQRLRDPNPRRAAQARERREDLSTLAEFLSEFHEVRYMTRQENLHAKAGNINQALCRTHPGPLTGRARETMESVCRLEETVTEDGGDLILILDCDHVPTRDFLLNTVGYFQQDPDLFLVQTPHFFVNPDPVERNLETYHDNPGENEMFYGAIQLGLDSWNASFFCGSAAVLRRSHLIEIGGLVGETITEDAETALTLHGRGYNSVYVSKPMVCGLSPETFDDFIVQRNRWTQGMIQIFLLKNPLFTGKMKFHQRLCYLNNCIFWFFGLARVMFFLAPLLFLIFGLNVYNASLSQVLAYAIPHVVGAVALSDYMFGHVRRPFFSELYEFVQGVFNVPALVSVILRPRAPSFKVTPKDRSLTEDRLSPLALPFYLMMLMSLTGFGFGIYRLLARPWEINAVLIAGFWAVFNFIFVLLSLGVVWEHRQIRRRHRIFTDEPATLRREGATEVHHGRVVDISEDGFGIELDASARIDRGDSVELSSRDSYGNTLVLPAVAARTLERDGKLLCGCEFSFVNELAWLDVVAYVYGDSKRWSDFWLNRRQRRSGVWKSLGYLCLTGFWGSIGNTKGVWRLIIKYIGQVVSKIRRRRLGRLETSR